MSARVSKAGASAPSTRSVEWLALAVLGCLVVLTPTASAVTQAQATFYSGYAAGSCAYGSTIPSNEFIGAWPDKVLSNGPQQDGTTDNCGACYELRCVDDFAESARGVVLDRSSACRDPALAIVIQIVDTCPCDAPVGSGAGNSDWCCNARTPKYGYDRHIDLSRAAFSALVKDGDTGLGVFRITYEPTDCSRGVGVVGGPTVPAIAALAPVPPGARDIRAFEQCGGSGGVCFQQAAGSCVDAPWPGTACHLGLACVRTSPFYWQCRAPAPGETSNLTPGFTPAPGPSTPPPSSSSPPPPSGSSTSPPPPSGEASPSPGAGLLPSQPGGSGGAQGSKGAPDLLFWDQCGGKGGVCGQDDKKPCVDEAWSGFSIPLGTSCTRQNEWYWQVIPGEQTQAPLKQENGVRTLRLYSQCGGSGGFCGKDGYACEDAAWSNAVCVPGSQCTRQNAYFFMCEPMEQVTAMSGNSGHRKLAGWRK